MEGQAHGQSTFAVMGSNFAHLRRNGELTIATPVPGISSACIALAFTLPAVAQAPARVVKNASVQLITGDDGKDDTDVFTIRITNGDGKFLERVFDAKEEIKPGTTFTLWLTRVRAEPQDQVKGSKIAFRIEPKGDDHWVVKEARLTVNYDNGPAEHWRWGPFVLGSKNSAPFTVEYALSDDRRY
jgi:hypothetical protein